jgi:hypothetical protein
MIAYLNLCARRPANHSAQGRFSDRLMPAMIAAWSLVVAAGLCAMWRYEADPGDRGAPPTTWPVQSKIVRDGRPTLLVFAHPLCPCTRATLAELERLVAVCPDPLDVHVVFIAPGGTDASWRDSELFRIAQSMRPVTVDVDTGRRETELFRERTSGSCLLYDPSGKLLFQGGLTTARGHEGDNPGVDSILALMMHHGDHADTPVFGCPLFEGDDRVAPLKPICRQEPKL